LIAEFNRWHGCCYVDQQWVASCATSMRHAGEVARGVVKFFKETKGWGAISSGELPEGQDAWVHYSVIARDDRHPLRAGDVVEFEFERARQDSFTFRATWAHRVAPGPAPILRRVGQRVVIADDGTPDTALTPKCHHR
jgi:CspA family cold shock protein